MKSLKIDPFKGDNSNIIDQMDELQFIFTYIKQEDPHFQFNNLRLLYRGSRDGDNTETCHKLCDEKENVLILIKSIKFFSVISQINVLIFGRDCIVPTIFCV